ncbi:MAG: hypothetical protein EB045_05785, partial [Actinobacteria bacterium]|nr:hypothetical protein [Actinomycetota bacterium]
MARFGKTIGDKNEQGHGGLGGTSEEINPPHGGVPVVVERHQPVETGKGEAEHEQRNEAVSGVAGTQGNPRVTVLILLDRPAAIQQGCGAEEEKIEGTAGVEERLVEEGALPSEQGIVGSIGRHPVPK